MNKENILKVAKAIKEQKLMRFDMNTYLEYTGEEEFCGTAGCIAGFGFALKMKEEKKQWKMNSRIDDPYIEIDGKDIILDPYCQAQEYMGLTNEEAQHLFIPSMILLSTVTPEQAISVLEKFAETEEINWND